MPRNNKGDEPKKRKAAAKGDKPSPKGEEGEPLRRDPDADPVKVHRDYVERRLRGGAPPSPEAYARALEQWHRLPGSVSTPTSEVRREEAEKAPKEGEEAESEEGPPDREAPS